MLEGFPGRGQRRLPAGGPVGAILTIGLHVVSVHLHNGIHGSVIANQAQTAPFAVIGRFRVTATWNGAPLVLQVNDNANMPQTTNGSMVLTYENLAEQNNQGTIAVTSGGARPEFREVPALANQPSLWVNNWRANNLQITNVSANSATPIRVQAVGPGIPGTNPLKLPVGVPLALSPGQMAQARVPPRWMQLVMRCDSSDLAVFAVIGGPPDDLGNNAYVFQINAPSNTPPPGYYAATTANSYTYQLNWGSSVLFVANLSGATSDCGEVTLRQL
jgi:hypothetical protein